MYDEPTAGLDPVASTVVEDLMRSMHDSEELNKNGSSRRSGITSYIVVTHQHSTIRRAVDRLIFLHEVSRRLALPMHHAERQLGLLYVAEMGCYSFSDAEAHCVD